MKVAVFLVKNVLVSTATMVSVSAIDSVIQRKMRGWRVVRAGKGINCHFKWR